MSSPRGQAVLDVIDRSPGDELPYVEPLVEQGRTGLRRTSGYVDDEFLPQLKGRKGVRIFREISDNDPTVGAFINAVMLLLAQLEWHVEAGSSDADGQAKAQLLRECMDDMEHSWKDMIAEIASFVIYGWELSEVTYKKCLGPDQKDPKHRSSFDDGKYRWRKIAGRAQETMLRWVFNDEDDILGMVQMAPPRYDTRVLNLNKCILFRTTKAKNNPEGRSLLRNAYVPYFMLKRIRETEAVGIERDLTGVPIAKIPPKYLSARPGTREASMLAAVKKLVTAVRRNEQEGIVWPWQIDGESKLPMFDFELLTSGGSRQFDISGIIDRYKTEILQSVLADFIMVGHENNGGSYALHTDKSGLFRTSINALADKIADAFNRQEIPRLMRLNGLTQKNLPKIKPASVDPPDLVQLGQFLTQVGGLGMPTFPDPELEAFLRDAAGLPKLAPELLQVRQQQQRQQTVLDMAQQRLELIQVDQQAEQGQLQLEQAQMQMQQQQAELEAGPGVDPGDPDGAHAQAQAGESTNQARMQTQVQAEKLRQEKERTRQMRAQHDADQRRQSERHRVDVRNTQRSGRDASAASQAQVRSTVESNRAKIALARQQAAQKVKQASTRPASRNDKKPVKKSAFGVDHSNPWGF